MKTVLKAVLKWLAQRTIAKYLPRVVGITGSVGKTSTKDAVAAVLRAKLRVGSNSKNLNNEIGLPLGVLCEDDSGYRNPFKWLAILIRAGRSLVLGKSNYPEVLVLEYGVDHRGDMDYLLRITKPDVAVVTAVSPTHLEFMGSVDAVAKEKGKLVTALPAGGTAVLNSDDQLVLAMGERTKSKVITYGLNAADVRAENVSVSRNEGGAVRGMSFKLVSGGSSIPVLLPGVIGKPPVASALAAAAVGISFGMSALDVGEALRTISFPPGRLRILSGIKNTTLLDDTYNSSPRAAEEALDSLAAVPLPDGARRWAVLGDMLELGEQSETLHRQLGEAVVKSGCDYLVTVGERARDIARGAVSRGLAPDRTWHFARAEEAGLFVQERLQPGDLVLIKGSQGVRCEKITKELMAEPQLANKLLVRQYKPWV